MAIVSEFTVDPALTDRLPVTILGKDHWIEVKRELSVGEQRSVDLAGFRRMSAGNQRAGQDAKETPERESEFKIDWEAQGFARAKAYIVDWSLTDTRGNKLKVADTIDKLKKPVFAVIEAALNAHVEAQQGEKEP